MKNSMLVAAGLLCLVTVGASAKGLESVKIESGVKFSEAEADPAQVGETSPVDGSRFAGSTSEPVGLQSPVKQKLGRGKEVPAPAVAAQEVGDASLWRKAKIAGALFGVAGGAAAGLPAIGSGLPLLVAFPVAGLIIIAGAGIGYGAVVLAQRLL